MKDICSYLDDLKSKYGSDYKTAKVLDIDRTVLSNIRKRNAISEEFAFKIADDLGIEREEILLAMMVGRSQGESKLSWVKISERAGFFTLFFVLNQYFSYVIDLINVYYVKYLSIGVYVKKVTIKPNI